MINLSLAEVSRALNAGVIETEKWAGPPLERFPTVSTDSRSIREGQCFVAIRGKNFDGHEFVGEALEAGATVVIASCPPPQGFGRFKNRIFLQVRDTTVALQALAHYTRQKWGSTLVAITGSVGKTTTRRFTAQILEAKFSVLQSIGNFNNEIGVPLSLLALTEEHDIALLELGMNHAGEIRLLSRISSPNVGVLLNVEPAHLEFFESIDEIAEAKGELLEHLDPQGTLVYNLDDHRVRRLAQKYSGKRVSFGLNPEADIAITGYRILGLQQMMFELSVAGESLNCQVDFAGRHFLYSIASAVAAGHATGVLTADLGEAIRTLKPFKGRCQTLRVKTVRGFGITLLDDSYNSSPAALRAVLEVVRQVQGFPRKVLALGDMLELGDASDDLHRQAGLRAAESEPDTLVFVGQQAAQMAQGAIEAGFPQTSVFQFSDSVAAGRFLAEHLREGDLLLCKGSRGVRMEQIMTCLLAGEGEQEQ